MIFILLCKVLFITFCCILTIAIWLFYSRLNICKKLLLAGEISLEDLYSKLTSTNNANNKIKFQTSIIKKFLLEPKVLEFITMSSLTVLSKGSYLGFQGYITDILRIFKKK